MSDSDAILEKCKCCFCNKMKDEGQYNPKILCDCGKVVNLLSMHRHKQTMVHTNWTLGIKQRKTKYQIAKERSPSSSKSPSPKSQKFTIDNTLMSLKF
jgi:hypothetical protein